MRANAKNIMFPTNFDILKFILGTEAWGNETKEIMSLEMISFVLICQV